MSDPSTPPPTSATLSAPAGAQVAQSEPFEPTYALLDPEALDLNDFEDGFETGVDDYSVDPPPLGG